MLFDPTQHALLSADDACASMFGVPGLRELLENCIDSANAREKRRRSLPAILVFVLVLAMVVHRSKSIPNVMVTIAAGLRRTFPDLPLKPVTAEALLHARSRLGAEPLKLLFAHTSRQIRRKKTLAGRTLWAIDGTGLDVPDTPANEAEFGRPTASRGRSAFPQLQLVVLQAVATREIRAFVVQKCDDPEQEAGWKLLDNLGPGDLLLVDRGFASGALLYECKRRGIDVLMRIKKNFKPFLRRNLADGDDLVELVVNPPKWAPEIPKRQRVRGRLITYRFGKEGEIVRLVTTLRPEEATALELALGYHLRWEIELGFDEIKTHLATTTHGVLRCAFRGKRPELVQQEVFALMAAYNLIRGLMADAASAAGLDPLNISFVDTVEVLRLSFQAFLAADPLERPELHKRLLQDIADCRNRRPRRGRRAKRCKKVKMCSWPVKKPNDRSQRVDFRKHLRLVDCPSGLRSVA